MCSSGDRYWLLHSPLLIDSNLPVVQSNQSVSRSNVGFHAATKST